jgi:hypothetical protein
MCLNEATFPDGYAYGVERNFQQHFSYMVAISFIGRGNWSARKKHLPVASH